MSDPWYKDAILYELHVKAFQDGNGDGVGDFRGLIERLDYIRNLGVTCLWLLPFFPSPLRDDGYDIADFHDVAPAYGIMADFEAFLQEAHRRGLHVIADLVLNHTSDQHPWFQEARRDPASLKRPYYFWNDDDRKYHARSKDPAAVVRAYRLARKYVDCRLVLAGWGATDSAEGQDVLAEVREAALGDPDVHVLVLPADAAIEINALQRAAAIVIQLPRHEDFGLTVAEAMWKGKPVIGSLAGGIPAQVIPETTGFIVTSTEGAAFRIRQLLDNPELMARLGGAAREYVRRAFLITRHVGDYLAVVASLTS